MAGFNVLAGLAPAAVQKYDPMLTPEANAMAGVPAAPVAAPGFQRPKGLRNTIGNIADILAVLGGEKAGYRGALDAAEKEFEADAERQKIEAARQAFGNYLVNPADAEADKAFKMADPATAFKVLTELTPKPASQGSRPREVVIAEMLADPTVAPEVKQRLEQLVNSRLYATAEGYRTGPEAIGIDPYRAPPAPVAPSFSPVVGADGVYSFDQRSGQVRPTGIAPPTKTSAAAGDKAAPAGPGAQLAVLDEGIADLKRAEALLAKGGVTGPLVGALPEFARNIVAPTTITAEEAVGRVAQKELRAILGGQFAAKEGEQLIRRAFNPSQSEAENLKRVQSLRRQIEARRKEIAGKASGQAPAATATDARGNKIMWDGSAWVPM